jgi:hypothetical protein
MSSVYSRSGIDGSEGYGNKHPEADPSEGNNTFSDSPDSEQFRLNADLTV